MLLSFRGFDAYPHGVVASPYNPSGISVIGGLGQPGALAVVAVETVPPLPANHAALYLVDVSKSWGLK